MRNNATLYGGFQGTETLLSERVFSCDSCSILSGEIGSPGLADNSYTVVHNEDLNNTAVINGFIIRDANDDRSVSNSGNGLGGGLYNHGYGDTGFCHPTIRNCIFTNNRASWGAFNDGYEGNSEPTYINCIFYQNHSTREAGGMYSYGVGDNASPTVINTIFYDNTADTNVGAMYAWGGRSGNSNPILINCVFANNRALNGYGGAFIADSQDPNTTTTTGACTVTLENCILWNNSATTDGPQFYVRGTSSQVAATYSSIDMTQQNAPHIISGADTGNLNSNPLFQDINNALGIDGCWLTADDGLQLQAISNALDSGTNASVYATDILGR